jgi:hypothetical protein
LTVAEQRVVGRITSGNVAALTGANLWTILTGQAGADLAMNTKKITGVVDPVANQDVATKKYVDDQVGGVNEFTELTDTPANYTSAGLKVVRVNTGADALEFVSFASTYLDDTPVDGETNQGITSNWAFDHNAAATGVHGAGGNTLLNSGSTIDGGAFA